MPVAVTNIRSALVAALELIQEQPELRLGRESTSLNDRVGGKIIVGSHDRPPMCDFHRNGPVHGKDLPIEFNRLIQLRGSRNRTHKDFFIDNAPAARERDLVAASGLVEFVEFPI